MTNGKSFGRPARLFLPLYPFPFSPIPTAAGFAYFPFTHSPFPLFLLIAVCSRRGRSPTVREGSVTRTPQARNENSPGASARGSPRTKQQPPTLDGSAIFFFVSLANKRGDTHKMLCRETLCKSSYILQECLHAPESFGSKLEESKIEGALIKQRTQATVSAAVVRVHTGVNDRVFRFLARPSKSRAQSAVVPDDSEESSSIKLTPTKTTHRHQ